MEEEQIPFLESVHLSCDDVDELLDCYLDGEMIPALVRRFNQHLSTCETCRRQLDETRHLIKVARSLSDEPIPAAVSARLRSVLEQKIGRTFTKSKLTIVK